MIVFIRCHRFYLLLRGIDDGSLKAFRDKRVELNKSGCCFSIMFFMLFYMSFKTDFFSLSLSGDCKLITNHDRGTSLILSMTFIVRRALFVIRCNLYILVGLVTLLLLTLLVADDLWCSNSLVRHCYAYPR